MSVIEEEKVEGGSLIDKRCEIVSGSFRGLRGVIKSVSGPSVIVEIDGNAACHISKKDVAILN